MIRLSLFQNWPPIEDAVKFSCDKCQSFETSRTSESLLLNKAACSNDKVEESKDLCESEISTSGLSIWLNQEDSENVRNSLHWSLVNTDIILCKINYCHWVLWKLRFLYTGLCFKNLKLKQSSVKHNFPVFALYYVRFEYYSLIFLLHLALWLYPPIFDSTRAT